MLSLVFVFNSASTAHAGVFDYVKSLFIAQADQKEIISDANSQTASLLKPMSAVLSVSEGETAIIEDSALISGSGPMGTIADFEYLAPTGTKIETYKVQKGDNLGKIANLFGVSTKTIVWANQDIIGSGNIIKEGQTLMILPITGIRHTVKSGDTIQSIANKYGGDVDEILKYNNIDSGAKLAIGDEIVVPDGEIKATVQSAGTKAVTSPLRVAKGLPDYSGYYIKPAINVRKTQGLHGNNAVDLAPLSHKEGVEPILAAASGEVIVSRSNSGWDGGYGKLIVISHPNGTQTVYGHCYTIFVSEGDHVEQGQVIGIIGNTGKSTGPHLHFEVRGAKNPF